VLLDLDSSPDLVKLMSAELTFTFSNLSLSITVKLISTSLTPASTGATVLATSTSVIIGA